MHRNSIAQALDACAAQWCPKTGPWIIAVTGSGGKTTTIEQLARYWEAQGLSVLVSTTTHMAHPDVYAYRFAHHVVLKPTFQVVATAYPGQTVLYGSDAGDKIASVAPDLLQQSINRFDRVLIEADGARQLPLKIHSERDPVIPDQSSMIIAVMGLGAYMHDLDDRVMFLSSHYRKLHPDDAPQVTEQTYVNLIAHPDGVLKACGSIGTVVCCNQSDAVDAQGTKRIVEAIRHAEIPRDISLMCCSWHNGTLSHYEELRGRGSTHESI